VNIVEIYNDGNQQSGGHHLPEGMAKSALRSCAEMMSRSATTDPTERSIPQHDGEQSTEGYDPGDRGLPYDAEDIVRSEEAGRGDRQRDPQQHREHEE